MAPKFDVKALEKDLETEPERLLMGMFLQGFPAASLQSALAKEPGKTNSTREVLIRLIEAGFTPDSIKAAVETARTDKQKGVQVPPLQGAVGQRQEFIPTPGATPIRGAVPPPGTMPELLDLGSDRRTQTGTATGGGAGEGGTRVVYLPAPAQEKPKTPQTPEEIEKFVRQKYGSYSWMLDDPNFAEVRKVLMDGAVAGLDDQALEAQLKNTDWWKKLDNDQREWDIAEKTGGSTIANQLSTNRGIISATASKMGVTLDSGRLDFFAREMGRNAWTELEITGALSGEAVYKPDFGGDIGEWETKVKNIARAYLQPISDEAAFGWAKQAVAGTIDEDNIKQSFIQQSIGMLPEYQKQLEAGVSARDILNPQIQTIAGLLEIDPEAVDLVGDVRFSPIVSNADKKVMSVTQASRHVKGLDDYWKTNNASKEVSGLVSGLAQQFGKLA